MTSQPNDPDQPGTGLLRALPHEHPVVTAALSQASIAGRQAAADLAATGAPIRLGWIDPFPATGPDQPPRPGQILCEAWFQAKDIDPAPGYQAGTAFRTARVHQVVTEDDLTLTLPVWRGGRRDLPHTPACAETCDECGTGEYWTLPNYVWPERSRGLEHPDRPGFLSEEAAFLYALADKRLKVRLTDYARYAQGGTGRPEKPRRGRLMSVTSTESGDRLMVKWRDNSSRVLRPYEVEFLDA